MPGAGIRIEVQDDDLHRALERLRRRLRNLGPALDEIGARLEASTLRRFELQTSPAGVPWPPSQRARDEGGETLTDSARLRASITRRVSQSAVEVGTNVVYAAIHQFGGKTPPRTIRPVTKKALFWPGARHPVAKVEHPGSKVPARPFLGFSGADYKAVARIIEQRIERAWAA